MSAEQLLYAMGEIREEFVREAAPRPAALRRSWRRAAGLAACLGLALLAFRLLPPPAYTQPLGDSSPADSEIPAEGGITADSGTAADPAGAGMGAPSLTVDGVTYVISGWFEHSAECPEGFSYAGETAVSYHDEPLPYYTSPEHPEWVYIYQECYNQQTQEFYMAYVRYVEEVLRGLTLIRYQETIYVFLNDTYYLPYQTEVSPEDQARYDAVPYSSVLKELPEGFEPVGKTVFDGHDAVPTSELGSSGLPGQQVLANPAEPDILLLRNYWSGLKGPDYRVFVRYQD